MSSKSNDKGRAYEFSYLVTLFEEISKIRPVKIEKNKNYFICEIAWNMLSNNEKKYIKLVL